MHVLAWPARARRALVALAAGSLLAVGAPALPAAADTCAIDLSSASVEVLGPFVQVALPLPCEGHGGGQLAVAEDGVVRPVGEQITTDRAGVLYVQPVLTLGTAVRELRWLPDDPEAPLVASRPLPSTVDRVPMAAVLTAKPVNDRVEVSWGAQAVGVPDDFFAGVRTPSGTLTLENLTRGTTLVRTPPRIVGSAYSWGELSSMDPTGWRDGDVLRVSYSGDSYYAPVVGTTTYRDGRDASVRIDAAVVEPVALGASFDVAVHGPVSGTVRVFRDGVQVLSPAATFVRDANLESHVSVREQGLAAGTATYEIVYPGWGSVAPAFRTVTVAVGKHTAQPFRAVPARAIETAGKPLVVTVPYLWDEAGGCVLGTDGAVVVLQRKDYGWSTWRTVPATVVATPGTDCGLTLTGTMPKVSTQVRVVVKGTATYASRASAAAEVEVKRVLTVARTTSATTVRLSVTSTPSGTIVLQHLVRGRWVAVERRVGVGQAAFTVPRTGAYELWRVSVYSDARGSAVRKEFRVR